MVSLIAEVGRHRVTQAMFCTPSESGKTIVSEGRFTISTEPTRYLYTRFAFDFTDAGRPTIRELGLFVGTVVKSTVLTGQD
jgi:hypothetical protein